MCSRENIRIFSELAIGFEWLEFASRRKLLHDVNCIFRVERGGAQSAEIIFLIKLKNTLSRNI